MTIATKDFRHNESERFKISMLLNDKRYRSMTIQIFALVSFLSLIFWLANNAVHNLNSFGKELGFGFLWDPAGYDINQRLISYDATMTNARAAVVGVLNTLLIAILGCATATLLGVFVGILRLSKNWLIARIMTIYIEGFRNIPVLLCILLIMTIFIEIFPTPREFRGENATASLIFFESTVISNRGIYIPKPEFFTGSFWMLLTLIVAVVAMILFSGWAKKSQKITGKILPIFWINITILIVPLIIIYFVAGRPIGFEYPELKGFNFKGGLYIRNSLIALWLALSLYTAAFIGETVRSGIEAISKGQSEAAQALGLRSGRVMRLVILPQALRVIIPPIISQYLNLTKNSSLAIAVGYMDITGTLGGITLNQTGREMECLLILMAIYLTISLSVSAMMNWYNDKVKLKER